MYLYIQNRYQVPGTKVPGASHKAENKQIGSESNTKLLFFSYYILVEGLHMETKNKK